MSTLYIDVLNALVQKVHKDKMKVANDECAIQLRIKDIESLVSVDAKSKFQHYKESNPELYYRLLSCDGDKDLELKAYLIYC